MLVYYWSFIGSYKINIRKIGFIGRLGCMGLHQLEAQPGSHPHRRLYNKLGSSVYAVMPSPLQSDIQNPDESNNRPNRTDSSCSSLASPALVASSSETSNISASVATEFEQSNLNGPDRTEFIQCILAFTWPRFTSLPTLPN